MLGGIEAGGTKFVCGVGTGPSDLRTASFPTTSPAETLAKVVGFFSESGVRAIGVGSFGPVDLDMTSKSFGSITSTPKVGWSNFDVKGAVERVLGVPVAFDTDVNAALWGEAHWGAARSLTDAIYMTVGTGIGVGALSNGRLVHGLVHPEMGHLRIPHDKRKDPFKGACPYHEDCLEGLAAGPAIEARWGRSGRELKQNHRAWELETEYLGQALANIIFVLSPQRIILGGGVMQNQFLYPMVRSRVSDLLGGYVRHDRITEQMDQFIVPPQLGSQAGVLGAIAMAADILRKKA